MPTEKMTLISFIIHCSYANLSYRPPYSLDVWGIYDYVPCDTRKVY